MVKYRTRKFVYVENDMLEEIAVAIDTDDTQSFSDFVNRALRFYIGFLNTKKAETYLLTTFQAAITGTIGGAEERISRLLYKNCVELAMLNRILAYSTDMTEEQLTQIYEEAEEEVNSIIGYWDRNKQ